MKLHHLRRAVSGSAALVATVGLVLSGCVTSEDLTAPGIADGSGSGTVSLSMAFSGSLASSARSLDLLSMDGPKERTALADLVLTIEAARLFPVCEEDTMTTADDSTDVEPDSSSCGPFEVMFDPVTVNAAGIDTVTGLHLGSVDVPSGAYHQVWLYLSSSQVVTADGETHDAPIPGKKQRFKVHLPVTVADGTVSDFVLKMDLSKSIVESPPGSKNFHLKPVVRGQALDQE